jgi:hypothetical protein
MRDINEVLLEYVQNLRLPAWLLLAIMEARGYSEFESLIALLLHVQAGRITVDQRGRVTAVIAQEDLPHEA